MAIKKIQMRPEGVNDYADVLHPETSADMVKFADGSTVESHKAEDATQAHLPQNVGLGNVDNVKQMPISGGDFTGISKAHSNTSYTVAQIRNIVLSTGDANVSAMQDGDIWIKYK